MEVEWIRRVWPPETRRVKKGKSGLRSGERNRGVNV